MCMICRDIEKVIDIFSYSRLNFINLYWRAIKLDRDMKEALNQSSKGQRLNEIQNKMMRGKCV